MMLEAHNISGLRNIPLQKLRSTSCRYKPGLVGPEFIKLIIILFR